VPGRQPIERRNQLMLDMTNPNVINYLYESLIKVLDECQPDYIKWDYNRPVIDVYSHFGFKAGEWYHKQVLGSYKLFSLLTKRYPNTLFEGCSSGGCRFDLGILFYTPQIWGSDDTNTNMRLGIQCGTYAGYPQSTFGAHVTLDHCGMSTDVSSIEDRFNLNCSGAFGYEFNFKVFNEEELEIIRNQINYYKKHRELLQFGDYYCCDNYFDDGVNYSYVIVSKDKTKAIFTAFQKGYTFGQNVKLYKLKGLDENALYRVTERPQSNVKRDNVLSFTAYGDALMNYGVDLNYLHNVTDLGKYSGTRSKMFYIEKISD
jgi:alpha-galactosidase